MIYTFIKKIIRKNIYSKEVVNVYIHDEFIPQPSDISIQYANLKNIEDTLDFQDKKYIEIFKNFLVLDDIGYLGYITNKCVHRSWVKQNNKIVNFHWAYDYKLKDNEIFIHYCETDKYVRGRNIFPIVLNFIIQDSLDKKILITVNKHNIASIKSVKKVGFKLKKMIYVTIFLGMKFIKEVEDE